jgi:WASH complex subunit 7
MSLCSEISELKAEAEKKFFIQLIMYEERVSAKDLQEGEAQLQLGRILPLLQVKCTMINLNDKLNL